MAPFARIPLEREEQQTAQHLLFAAVEVPHVLKVEGEVDHSNLPKATRTGLNAVTVLLSAHTSQP